ncbi:MAG: anti-sigma factor family protein [Anaerolineae bacterium]
MGIFFNSKRADHRFTAENMSAYIDSRLSPREVARLERHLAHCETCSVGLATLRQTKLLMQSAPVLRVPRSFTLPASAQVQRVRYQRMNRSFTMLGSASAVVALLLVVLIASDVMFSFLGIPASTAPYVSGPMLSRSAPSAGVADAQLEPVASSEAVAELIDTPTEQSATAITQENGVPSSESPQPTDAAVGKVAAAPRATPPSDEPGTASIEAAAVDTVTTTAKSLAVEPSVAATANATSEAPSAEPIPPSPTPTETVMATPIPPSPTATLAEATATPAEVAAIADNAVQGEAETPAPVDDSWSQEPLWLAWRGVRIAALVLAGVLCILMAGLLWTGYLRRN